MTDDLNSNPIRLDQIEEVVWKPLEVHPAKFASEKVKVIGFRSSERLLEFLAEFLPEFVHERLGDLRIAAQSLAHVGLDTRVKTDPPHSAFRKLLQTRFKLVETDVAD